MPQLLKLKNLRGVHLVDKGAAIAPYVLVIKRANARAMEDPMPLKDKIVEAVSKALGTALDDVLKADGEPAGDKSPQQLLEMALAKVPEDTRAAILAAVGAMYQAQPPKPAPVEMAAPAPEPPAPAEKPAPVDEEMRAKKKAKDTDEIVVPAELTKGLKPEQKSVVEKAYRDGLAKARAEAEEAGKDLVERVAKAEDEIAKATADRELAQVEKAIKSFTHVPGDLRKRAGILLAVKKQQGDKAYDELLRQFKAAHELIAKGKALDTNGTSREDGDEGGEDMPAEAELQKKADELRKDVTKSGKKLTTEQAYARAVDLYPELYAKAQKERRTAN